MIVSEFSVRSSISQIPPSEDDELQTLKSEIMLICSESKHDCLMSPAEKYMELLRHHFKSLLKYIPEHEFLRVVTEALQEAEGFGGQQASLNELKRRVRSKLEVIAEEAEERERERARERAKLQKSNRERRSSMVGEKFRSSVRTMTSSALKKKKSLDKKLKSVASHLSTAFKPQKWKDTRRVTYNKDTERSSLRASESIGRRNLYKSKTKNSSNLRKKKSKPKKSKRKQPGNHLYSSGLTYAQNKVVNAVSLMIPDKPRKGKKKKRKRSQSKANKSQISNQSEGFSNARMLRIFVKDAVKERHGTDELDAAILNRSLSQASMRIFNDIRDKERNSPIKILEKVGQHLAVGDRHHNHGSRDSTLSLNRMSNLVRDIGNESRSLRRTGMGSDH